MSGLSPQREVKDLAKASVSEESQGGCIGFQGYGCVVEGGFPPRNGSASSLGVLFK